MIVDSHCHLDYPSLNDSIDLVLQRANLNKIDKMLTICTTFESFKKIELLISKYNKIYGTFGIHPHETSNHQQIDKKFICEVAKKNKKIIGIGETGLDFYYNHSEKKIQKKSFINHIKAASELNIPLIVHSRNAEEETYEILKNEKKTSDCKVLIHCFTGSKNFAKKILDLNFYISISGIITFKNSTDLVDVVSYIPSDRLLVETDSPYLAPLPYRGKTNEPSYIVHTLEKLALIKNLTFKQMAIITTQNFNNLFKIT